jgi:hypothetical protein
MKNTEKQHGGQRAGAGRKPDGRVWFRARVRPEQIPVIEKFISELTAIEKFISELTAEQRITNG